MSLIDEKEVAGRTLLWQHVRGESLGVLGSFFGIAYGSFKNVLKKVPPALILQYK